MVKTIYYICASSIIPLEAEGSESAGGNDLLNSCKAKDLTDRWNQMFDRPLYGAFTHSYVLRLTYLDHTLSHSAPTRVKLGFERSSKGVARHVEFGCLCPSSRRKCFEPNVRNVDAKLKFWWRTR